MPMVLSDWVLGRN